MTEIPQHIILSVKYKARGINFNISNYTTQTEHGLDLKDKFTINRLKLTHFFTIKAPLGTQTMFPLKLAFHEVTGNGNHVFYY